MDEGLSSGFCKEINLTSSIDILGLVDKLEMWRQTLTDTKGFLQVQNQLRAKAEFDTRVTFRVAVNDLIKLEKVRSKLQADSPYRTVSISDTIRHSIYIAASQEQEQEQAASRM